MSDVKYGVIEPDGTLTVILKQPQHRSRRKCSALRPRIPVCRSLSSDGKIVPRSLELLHLSPADIERRLKTRVSRSEDVFLMTLRRLRQHVPAEKGGPCMKRLLTAAVLCTALHSRQCELLERKSRG